MALQCAQEILSLFVFIVASKVALKRRCTTTYSESPMTAPVSSTIDSERIIYSKEYGKGRETVEHLVVWCPDPPI
jgi:hypothetical protein